MFNPYNNSFWDFVGDMNGQQGQAGPHAGRNHHGPRRNDAGPQPWEYPGWGFPHGGMPHRGRHGPHPPPFVDNFPPPPPPGAEGHIPPPPAGLGDESRSRPGTPGTPPEDVPEYPGRERSSSPPGAPHGHQGPPHHGAGGPGRRHHGRHGGRGGHGGPGRHGRHGGPDQSGDEAETARHGGPHGGPGHRGPHGPRGPHGRHGGPNASGDESDFGRRGGPHRGPHGGAGHHGPHGRHGRHGRHGPQPPFDFGMFPQYLNQLPDILGNMFGPNANWNTAARNFNNKTSGEGTFIPDVDVFNTPEAYIIHASIPGAKKGDMDVSYDAAINAVKISGVIQRPSEVDETMLSTMVEGERGVGLFERTVRLDKDARVDAEGLSAKLEDGVLRIEIPKEAEEEWTDVKRIQVE